MVGQLVLQAFQTLRVRAQDQRLVPALLFGAVEHRSHQRLLLFLLLALQAERRHVLRPVPVGATQTALTLLRRLLIT